MLVWKDSTGLTRVYDTHKARACAVAIYARRGENYFVGFKEWQGFGLQHGTALWAGLDGYFLDLSRPKFRQRLSAPVLTKLILELAKNIEDPAFRALCKRAWEKRVTRTEEIDEFLEGTLQGNYSTTRSNDDCIVVVQDAADKIAAVIVRLVDRSVIVR